MILTNKADYSKPHDRIRLAKLLSCVIQGEDSAELPYKPNQNDDMFWTLDLANDWKVKFHPEQPRWFEIIYRYQCPGNQYEQALAAWLAVRCHATPVV